MEHSVNTECALDQILSNLISLGGAGSVVVDLYKRKKNETPGGHSAVQIGVHRAGPLPGDGVDAFDILLSVEHNAPRPWVSVTEEQLEKTIAELQVRIESQPVAAAVAAQVLRMSLLLPFTQALILESLSYSTLLASVGFHAWRAGTPIKKLVDVSEPRILSSYDGSALAIHLNRPDTCNAFDARMRDELVDALAFALRNPEIASVELSGAGVVFCAGGDLNEFGRAIDPALAHLIRTMRSPVSLIHDLGARVTARLHGACIGAGIEIPAAAARVIGRPGTIFRLPEVSMGLIPGAGGTASIPRRVGRHRACYLAISGATLDTETALAWGLIDEVESNS
jgi:hypothetical protein